MEARLIYVVDGVVTELEKDEFENLDELTYRGFNSVYDIINSKRYSKKIGHLPKNGEVKIAFNGFDVPMESLDYFTEFGYNPFDGAQTISVLVSDRGIVPSKRSLRENIVRTLSSVDVVEEFHENFKHRYTPREEFLYVVGMILENDQDVFEGIKRIVNEATDGYDGYFIGRVFLEGLSQYDSVKNKDKNGILYSPRLIKK